MKKITLFFALLMLGQITTNAQIWNQVLKAVASDRTSSDFYGRSVAISGDYAIVGSYLEDEDASGSNSISDAGSVYIFEKNGAGIWVQTQKIVASDRGLNDQFGYSVSISGNYVIIGAHWGDDDVSGSNNMFNAGAAYIFERNGAGVWMEVQKIVASDRGSSDEFSVAVSISGDYAIVGAYEEDEDNGGINTISGAGSTYVFERNGAGTWAEVQKIVASDRGMNDNFGEQLAISGNYAIIGAMEENEDEQGNNTLTNSGSAYVFERNGAGVWLEVKKLVSSDREANDKFARSIAISGDYVLIGAAFEDHDIDGLNYLGNAGSVYIYERDGAGIWSETQKIIASDRGFADNFGWSVSIDGNNAIIGANLEDEDSQGISTLNDAGSCYIFERNGGGVWLETGKLNPMDRAPDDLFGSSVGISGGNLIVGAYWEDHDIAGNNFMDKSGSAYIFDNPGAVAIDEMELDANTILYPNPTKGQSTIKFNETVKEVTITVYDVLGKIISSDRLNNINQYIINIDKEAGVYFVSVSRDNHYIRFRLIKH